MKTIRAVPAAGRTVRFPAAHERAGEVIPVEGADLDESSSHVARQILRGDLIVVRSRPVKAHVQVFEAPPAEDGVEELVEVRKGNRRGRNKGEAPPGAFSGISNTSEEG